MVMAKKEKGEGRKPTLAAFVDEGFNIVGGKGDKFEARVRKDGMVVFRDKEYTSPSSAAIAALPERSIDGWSFWKYKKNDEWVKLNVLRGSKSPLKAASEAPRATKKAKSTPKKPKAARKPRKSTPEPQGVVISEALEAATA